MTNSVTPQVDLEAAGQQVFGKCLAAKYPEPVILHLEAGGSIDDVQFEDKVYAIFEDECYIYVMAKLPLQDYDSELMFGLWVNITEADLQRYIDVLNTQDNDEYMAFTCKGSLASLWPLFHDSYMDEVEVGMVDVNSRPFIKNIIDGGDVELNKYIAQDSLDLHAKKVIAARLIEFYRGQ
jgi:hypothetical protein